MLTQLAVTLLAQTAETSTPGWIWALVICLVAAAAGATWAFAQLRGTQRRLTQMTVEHESTTAAHRELLERERKQAKTLDEKRDEIRDLKRDLAAQKKKNHSSQEETKDLRKELRDVNDELARARKQQRPAFAEKPEPTEKKETKPAPEPEKPAPEPKVDADTASRIADLEAELDAKGEALKKDRTSLREARAELKNLRRRVEGLRRIDLVSTGKVEMLEDKLRAMGRQYYDAVSELAALKGEVKPPAPRELEPESERGRDEIAEVAEDGDGEETAEAAATGDDVAPPETNEEKSAEQTA
jgi:chromosome segregation ATPase